MASVSVAALAGGRIEIDEATLGSFAAGLDGSLIGQDDAGYEEARAVWNATVVKRPALIARCAGAGDVKRSLDFARQHGLLISVRGAGHNIAGSALCDGGLTIDLSQMRAGRCGRRRGHRPRAARSDARRCRWGHPSAWQGDPRRNQLHHRNRRTHTRRRIRLAEPQVRPDDRQPPVGRRRDCGRPRAHRERGGERRLVLGAQGRRAGTSESSRRSSSSSETRAPTFCVD